MLTESVNLARRGSVKNEPDLLQEDFSGDISPPSPSSPYTRNYCHSMVPQVYPDSPLPRECHQYQDVMVALQRRNSDRDHHAVAFAGMNPGEAAAAMAAREKGHLHHAQIQRRLTSSGRKNLW